MRGTRDWKDYEVTADVTPHLAKRAGIAARVQGLGRYYALELKSGNKLQLVEVLHDEIVLAETEFDWEFGQTLELSLKVHGDQLIGSINGQHLVTASVIHLPMGRLVCLLRKVKCTNTISVKPVR